jgi:hypothetical protein
VEGVLIGVGEKRERERRGLDWEEGGVLGL